HIPEDNLLPTTSAGHSAPSRPISNWRLVMKLISRFLVFAILVAGNPLQANPKPAQAPKPAPKPPAAPQPAAKPNGAPHPAPKHTTAKAPAAPSKAEIEKQRQALTTQLRKLQAALEFQDREYKKLLAQLKAQLATIQADKKAVERAADVVKMVA